MISKCKFKTVHLYCIPSKVTRIFHLYGYLKVQPELRLLNHHVLSAFLQLDMNTSHVNANVGRASVASLTAETLVSIKETTRLTYTASQFTRLTQQTVVNSLSGRHYLH